MWRSLYHFYFRVQPTQIPSRTKLYSLILKIPIVVQSGPTIWLATLPNLEIKRTILFRNLKLWKRFHLWLIDRLPQAPSRELSEHVTRKLNMDFKGRIRCYCWKNYKYQCEQKVSYWEHRHKTRFPTCFRIFREYFFVCHPLFHICVPPSNTQNRNVDNSEVILITLKNSVSSILDETFINFLMSWVAHMFRHADDTLEKRFEGYRERLGSNASLNMIFRTTKSWQKW